MPDELPSDLRTFLNGETDARRFHHADHIRIAFEILTRHPEFLDAATVYSRGLKSIAARAGNPAGYHETVTLAFLALIAERLAAASHEDFDAYAAANADLFDKNVLARWYPASRLKSELARRTFVLPAMP